MARSRNPVPSYLNHRPTGRAFVAYTVNGVRKTVYLGPYGSPESKAEYARVCRKLAAGRANPALPDDPTVNEVAAAFLRHAPGYYRRPDGTPTKEVSEFGYACRHLCVTLGDEPAAEVTPGKLKRVRDAMVAAGWCRSRINRQFRRVRQVFVWAAEEDMIPAAVAVGLRVVRGLRKDRSDARESEPVPPAPAEHVDSALIEMTPTVRTMVLLQRLTGMRPGEVREFVPAELDTTGAVWVYRPGSARPGGHKTDHLGQRREVWIGPKARAALEPWLAGVTDPHARLFTPKRSKEEWWAMRRAARKSKVTPSQVCRRKDPAKLRKRFRDWWTDDGYAQAVEKACIRAGVPPFAPNRVRHLFGTEVRAKYGLEAAQVLMGHTRADVTQVYAERDRGLAERVAAEVG